MALATEELMTSLFYYQRFCEFPSPPCKCDCALIDPNDSVMLQKCVAESLNGRHKGWESIPTSAVTLEQLGIREGYTKTYKVIGAGKAEPALLKILTDPEPTGQAFYMMQRMTAVAKPLMAHGLAPVLIANGPNWMLQAWEGTALGSVHKPDKSKCDDLGRLLARVHAVDTSWYDATRTRLCQRWPFLEHVDAGSHVWFFTNRDDEFCKFMDGLLPDMRQTFASAGPRAHSSIGKRPVTSHGDFHHANILQVNENRKLVLKLIDFDETCVQAAVYDLKFCFDNWCRSTQSRRGFLHAYLVESACPASDADINALWLDVQSCEPTQNHPGCIACKTATERWHLADMGNAYNELVALADHALANPKLADDVRQHGLRHCSTAWQGIMNQSSVSLALDQAKCRQRPSDQVYEHLKHGDLLRLSLSSHRGHGLSTALHSSYECKGATHVIWKLVVVQATDARTLRLYGETASAILCMDGTNVVLEVEKKRMKQGAPISLSDHGAPLPTDTCQRFCLNLDGTISPQGHGDLALGLKSKEKMILVPRESESRCVFTFDVDTGN